MAWIQRSRMRGGAASLASNALRAALTALSGSGWMPRRAGGIGGPPLRLAGGARAGGRGMRGRARDRFGRGEALCCAQPRHHALDDFLDLALVELHVSYSSLM